MENPWLHRFAVIASAAALFLIGIGGSVTSREAGLAVPDWPTTYGRNMFLFPVSQWVGGIFYEHAHRLAASAVGFLTILLAAWLWLKESRRWLRWLGVLAVALVIFQGVLGGLRVNLLKDELGIFHATIAQLFLVLLSAIALFTSGWWRNTNDPCLNAVASLRTALALATSIILVQLILGATMRHQHAGLAVPDFPLAYGKLWPPMDGASLRKFNQTRVDFADYNPITRFQIGLHMTHRIWAILVLAGVGVCARRMARKAGGQSLVAKLSRAWFGLVLIQAVLGAATVWSHKSADIATAHVVTGALCLVVGSTLSLMAFRPRFAAPEKLALPGSEVFSSSSISRQTAACTGA
jgi:cytochrome c oxidase assembly protein subunit 15